jgi:hypothetical protein
VATYKEKATAKVRNARGNDSKITHLLPAKGNLSLTLNGSKKEASAEVFFGQVDKSYNNFYLKVKGNELSGHIILVDQKKAYEYTSSGDGSAYLQEVDINKVICIDYELGPVGTSPTSSATSPSVASIANLQSLPGATAVILLDFDGQFVMSPYWNGGNPIDAAPSTLSLAEREEVWKLISEDFRPFDLNITTNETVYLNAPITRRQRVIFTPTNFFNINYGGVAQMNSFTWNIDTPCWAFNNGVKGAGEVGSHEIGHTLGLAHDGRLSPQEEYYEGHDSWAPIMGSSFHRPLTQWSKGEYLYANNLEDDLYRIVTQNGFGYRVDDHSNSSSNATPLRVDGTGNVSASLNKGIITTQNDVDVFSFTSSGKSVYFYVVPNPDHPNLDIKLTIKNSLGNTISIADPPYLDASLYDFLPAGTYYIYIDGVGGGYGAYSDYSSLGEYTINGLIEPNPVPIVTLTSPASGSTFAAPATVNINANAMDNDGSVSKVEFFQGTTKLGEDLTSPYSFGWNSVGAGSYQLTAKATDNLGAITTSTPVVITVNGTNLPSPWKNGDIGAVSLAGSASYSSGLFTVKSAGYDHFAAPDNFHYVYQPFTGNATIIAKVENIQNTNKDALAGVMIRENLNPSSSYVATVVNPSSTIQLSRQGSAPPAYKLVSGSAPKWLKLSRNGDSFTSSHSADGVSWITLGSVNVTMGSSVLVGLSLTSHAVGVVNTSTFSNVSVSTTPTTTPACTASGSILREYWGNITGSTVATIPLSTTPNATMQLTSFEAPTNVADSYGQRIRGYICAPASGNYTFYIASDNESELWLSTTDNPANKAKIASVTNGGSAWTNSREWTKYPGQKSVSVSLQAGKRYYVEALHKENMNGDNLAVAWQTPTNATITVIPGAVLSPFVPSNAARIASIDQLQQPGLSIFPNPLSGEKLGMEISGMEKNQPMKLSLYNSLGALLFSQVLLTDENGGASRELHIDAKLFSGIYMLKVECKSISIVKRVVISR